MEKGEDAGILLQGSIMSVMLIFISPKGKGPPVTTCVLKDLQPLGKRKKNFIIVMMGIILVLGRPSAWKWQSVSGKWHMFS